VKRKVVFLANKFCMEKDMIDISETFSKIQMRKVLKIVGKPEIF
jgi:hypothetical protein